VITCKDCGTVNADGAVFCGGCGSFLEFTGERAPNPTGTAPAAGSGSGTASPPAAGAAGTASGPQAGPPPRHAGQPATDVGQAGPPPTHAHAGDPPAAQLPAAPATTAPLPPLAGAAAVPPAAGQATEAAGVTAHQPDAPLPPVRPPRPTPTEVPPEGSLVCGTCGLGNDPARKFCRRCGASLADAVVATRASWWQRTFGRKQSTYEAGERLRTRQPARVGRAIGLGLLAVLVAGVLLLAFPLRGSVVDGYHWVLNRVSTPVRVTTVRPPLAASSAKGHPPALVTDGYQNTFWAAAAGGKAQLTIRFTSTVHLDYVNVYPGASGDDPGVYLKYPRPRQLQITIDSPSGATRTVTLNDAPGLQKVDMDVTQASGATVLVTAVNGSSKTTGPAIAELEFYAYKY
jgi:hypothetical protein